MPRYLQVDHGRDLDLVERLVPLDARGELVNFIAPRLSALSFFFFLATSVNTIQAMKVRSTRYR